MDLKTKLKVKHYDALTYEDYSNEAHDFKRDPFSVTLDSTNYLYIGHTKQINAVFCQISTGSEVDNTLVVEYYNGAWVPLTVDDDTKCFTRSGFINWERQDDAEESAIDGTTAVWIRISSSENLDPVLFQAINIVFSDDNSLSEVEPGIVDAAFYPANQTSHILSHVAARNAIMSKLKSLGYVKYDEDGNEQGITEWDILDIFEMKQAATYYAAGQVYFTLSDNVEDQYWTRYLEYNKKFDEAFALGRLQIDLNDNGVSDSDEKKPIQTIRWVR
jgi:hypothetical protein